MQTLFRDVTLVNEGSSRQADILFDEQQILKIAPARTLCVGTDAEVLEGGLVLPGIIDEHIHSREPGLTHKGDLRTETLAAAAGGVTSVMDMPNVVPQTTTLEALEERFRIGAAQSIVNYSFYFGATNTNAHLLSQLDPARVCGVKVFMGSSTGGMLVDEAAALRKVFAASPRPVVTHCEDTALINANMQHAKALYGEDPEICHFPEIRSEEACYRSSSLAVKIASETGARLHIAHITTARELSLIPSPQSLLPSPFSLEVCVPHLLFCDEDYARLGSLIKCNPAVKSKADRDALRCAVADGRILTIATDHAPHLLSEKQGGCQRAVSGMPMVQFSLVAMLNLVEEGIFPIERLVEAMCHNPARLFGICQRGFVREGYKADLVRLTREAWTLTSDNILSKCAWSPLTGTTFSWRVQQTFCNGTLIYNRPSFPHIPSLSPAQELRFDHAPSYSPYPCS